MFNLSSEGHAACVRLVKGYGVPLMLLGGGGYKIINVARCWARETGVRRQQLQVQRSWCALVSQAVLLSCIPELETDGWLDCLRAMLSKRWLDPQPCCLLHHFSQCTVNALVPDP